MWLLVHIKNLPDSSRFYAEKRGGQQFRGWDASRYATVAIVNAVRALQFAYLQAHSKSKLKLPEPYPTPQRKNTDAPKPGSFSFIATSMLAAQRRKKAS